MADPIDACSLNGGGRLVAQGTGAGGGVASMYICMSLTGGHVMPHESHWRPCESYCMGPWEGACKGQRTHAYMLMSMASLPYWPSHVLVWCATS